MKNLSMGLAVFLLPTVGLAQFADSRNRAMGGTGVASSRYVAAGFVNPALLTRHDSSDSFGFILPSVGVGLSDEDGLVEAIEDFQDQVDRMQASFDPAMRDSLADSLANLRGRRATIELTGGLAVAMPSKTFAWSFIASTYIEGGVSVNYVAADDALIRGSTNPNDLNNIQTEGVIRGAGITEVGFAFAREIAPGFSIGVTPKAQRIDTYNYAINVNNFEDDDFDDSRYQEDETKFNFDVGAAFTVSDVVTVGITGRNLIGYDIESAPSPSLLSPPNAGRFTQTIDPRITVGAAADLGWFLATADVDVVDFDRIKEIADDESQFVRAGVEFDWSLVGQIRLGIQHDFEDTIEDLYTAGIGIAPFDLVHIDISGYMGEGDTYGAMAQFWFTF